MSEETQQPANQVFISYASADKGVARRLVDELKERGLNVWFDECEIKPGDDFSKAIREGIENSRYCIVLLSRSTAASKPWVSKEWAAIQQRSWRRPDFLICPVRLEDIDTPAFLRKWQSLKLDRESLDADANVDKIVSTLLHHWDETSSSQREAAEKEASDRFVEIQQWLNEASKGGEVKTHEA